MKIGIIGAQNSHTEHFCRAINSENQFPGNRVAYLYGGDAPEVAERLSAQYGVTLCASEEELIGRSDGVVITYRRGSAHFGPALKALQAGKPLFNDKPFTVSAEQTETLVSYARAHGLLLCGGSNLKGLPEIAELAKEMGPGKTAVISFGGDLKSSYDGYWFYGIHTAELCLVLCGENFRSVDSYRNGESVVSVVRYDDRTCVICTNPASPDLHVSVTGSTGTVHRRLPLNYQSVGPAEFIRMAEKKELPRPLSHYVSATRLMSAILDSIGKAEEQ